MGEGNVDCKTARLPSEAQSVVTLLSGKVQDVVAFACALPQISWASISLLDARKGFDRSKPGNFEILQTSSGFYRIDGNGVPITNRILLVARSPRVLVLPWSDALSKHWYNREKETKLMDKGEESGQSK